jgi:uncharacterized protein YsxB (DUF464 family)
MNYPTFQIIIRRSKASIISTLVIQQAQTIEELKKLNATAIRNLFYLQCEMHQYQTKNFERAQALLK